MFLSICVGRTLLIVVSAVQNGFCSIYQQPFWDLDHMHQEASLRLVKLGVVFHIETSFPTRKDHYKFLFPIILKFHFTPLLTPE